MMVMTVIKVLIVEDDPMVAELTRRCVAGIEGFEPVGVVSSADEALGFLSKGIDLILLDLFLPKMNGLTFLKKIRNVSQNVDVIMITAARDSININSALRLGVVDYLVKPFELKRLRSALLSYKNRKKFIEKQQVFNQEDIDRRIIFLEEPDEKELPKGVDRNTLQLVLGYIRNTHKNFSINDIAMEIGCSRVALRKYLQYLITIDILEVELEYGTVGRPTYKYRYTKKENISRNI